MSLESVVYAALSADSTLMDLLDGGLYAYSELPPRGLTLKGVPDAFSDNGQILTVCVVKQRARNRVAAVRDSNEQANSFRQVVELWLYDSYDDNTLEAVKSAIYGLLQHQKLTGFTRLEWFNDDAGHAPEYEESPFVRMDFEAFGIAR